MTERLPAAFPGLRTTPFQVTSPPDPAYNCIAWAIGDTTDWWWPLGDVRKCVWPAGAPREATLDAFRSAFQKLGFSEDTDDRLEPAFEKVALFADSARVPTHAARQLSTGRWTSKLGQSEDIEHQLRALEGDIYGSLALIVKRPTSART